MTSFTKDDKVRLITGDPTMKVLDAEDNYVYCEWINGLGDDMKGSSPTHLLTKVE